MLKTPSFLVQHLYPVDVVLANRTTPLLVVLRALVAHRHVPAIEKYYIPTVCVAYYALLPLPHLLQIVQLSPYYPLLQYVDVQPSLYALEQHFPRK